MSEKATQIIAYTLAAATSDNLAPFVSALGAGPLNAWLEDERRADGFKLRDDVAATEAAGLVLHWPQGHLFGADGHLQWERQLDGDTHLVLISEAPPPGLAARPLVPLDDETLLLWGERRDEWVEGRIPDVGCLYPKSWAGPFAVLKVQHYSLDWPEAQSERLVTRYLSFDGAYNPPAPEPAHSTDEANPEG